MRKIYLLALLIVFSINELKAQNVDYSTPLYTNATFSKVIDTSLPVGSISATSNVSSSGGATYSIPIATPPGTNGIAPTISVDYNSTAGVGTVGYGWNISGLSSINRSGQNVYHDGQTTTLDFTSKDRFTWDGQRLISMTGNYGANGTTYGLENENFSIVTSNGSSGTGPTWFKVITKDGVEMEYGNTTDSRVMDQTGVNVLFWRLNKLKNPDGNYITFKYVFDDRDSRIDEINYTGNEAAGIAPYNKIKFAYKIRSDVNTQYIASSSLLSKYLLDKITVTAESQTVKTYQFNYSWDNINSYLREIVESGSDGTSLNSTIIKYGEPPVNFEDWQLGNDEQQGNHYFVGDFNGDGKSDILAATSVNSGIPYYNYHTGFRTHLSQPGTSVLQPGTTQPLPPNYSMIQKEEIPNDYNILASDFTGDGLDDVVTLKITNTGSFSRLDSVIIYESINGGTEFTKHRRSVQPNFYKIHPNGNYFFPGDFDGDGISEYITILGNVNDNYDAFLCRNYLTGGACGAISTTAAAHIPSSSWAGVNQIHVLDFNGDGKSDLMLIKDFNTEIFTFDDLTARSIYYSGFPTKNHLIYFGDFNADRKTDLLVRNSLTNNSAAWTKAISTGGNYIETPFTFVQTPNITNAYYKNHSLNLADFNGDGKTDIFHGKNAATGSKLDVYYSKGTDFYHIQSDHTETISITASQTADFDGDGRSEILSRKAYDDPYNIYKFKPGGKEHLIHRIANGHGHISTWYYQLFSRGGDFYTKGSLSAYPFNSVQPSSYGVFQSITQNGIGSENTTTYSYEDAKLHRAGKGFLGFKKVIAADQVTGIKSISENEFNTTYYASVPKKSGKYWTTGNTLITENTLTSEFVQQGGVGSMRFLYRIKTNTENNIFEGRTTTATNNTFDDYGNVTKSTVVNNTETIVTNTLYDDYPSGVPNKPTSVTVNKTRSGETAHSYSTTLDYNAKGQLTSKIEFPGLPKSVSTAYEYFPLGNLKKTTVTPSGLSERSTSATYDSLGRFIVTSTNELLQTASAKYDPKWGKPLTIRGVDSLVTSYTYDAFGKLSSTTFPEGYTVSQTYDWDNVAGDKAIWFSLISHPGKPDVKTWYDLLGRGIKTQTEAFSSGWITQTEEYDSRGNVVSSTQPYLSTETPLNTTYVFDPNDPFNRITSYSNTLSSTTFSYTYASGILTTKTTTAGQESFKSTDVSGQLVSSTDNGGTLTYSYYSHGGLREVKSGPSILTKSEYDDYGRQTKLTDLNAGVTTYEYNALGELATQTHAGTHSMLYDLLGRNTSRNGPEGVTTYEYYPSNSAAATNQLKKANGFSGNFEEYTYDSFGRVQTSKETIDGTSYTTTYGYNTYGDVTSVLYPSGFGTNHAFDSNGYPTTIKNQTNTITLYTNNGLNGTGQNTSYSLGNTKSSTRSYHYGIPKRFTTSGIQDLELFWDYSKGNLTTRKDYIKSKEEGFTYDNLNRLTAATVVGQSVLSMNYAANGNMSSKTDAGNTYNYHPTRVNAVTEIITPGNAIPHLQQDIAYTAFQQPDTIRENGNQLIYTYGSDYERVKSVMTGTASGSRYYFDGYEKDVTTSSTKHLHYISSPAGLIAIVIRENGNDTYHYTYTDHLGSILTITNNSGVVSSEQNFDAWGRFRNPTDWTYNSVPVPPTWLYRGYTSHEHLPQFGLINMNGRMYDPVVGRMLSPDNYIQEPGMTQSFNRYSYAMNNPMVNTDPDGHFWNFVIGAAVGGFSGWLSAKSQGLKGWDMFDKIISGVAVGLITAGVADGVVAGFSLTAQSGLTTASIGVYATAGAVSGALSGASLAALNGGDVGKGALWGGLMGGASGALGGYLKHAKVKANIFDKSRYLADCPECKAMFPGVDGNWLDPVIVTGQRTLATGAVKPSYFFEELVIGNAFGKLAGSLIGMVKGVGLMGKGVAGGAQYSVAYEMKLASNLYPGKGYYTHFQAANKSLHTAMASDATMATSMSKLGVTIPRSPTGAILGKSPANWVWHHDVGQGVMQLVPKAQHTTGSMFWKTLHPGGAGGMSIWGK